MPSVKQRKIVLMNSMSISKGPQSILHSQISHLMIHNMSRCLHSVCQRQMTFGGSIYEQIPPSYPTRRNVTFDSSRYEPLPIPHYSQTNIAFGRSCNEKKHTHSPSQSNMMQDTSYWLPPPPYPILKHEVVHESNTKQQRYEPDTQV